MEDRDINGARLPPEKLKRKTGKLLPLSQFPELVTNKKENNNE